MDELTAYRKELDALDADMTALLCRRLALADEIGRWKAARGLPVTDLAREREVLRAAAARVPPDMAAAASDLMRLLIALATARQRAAADETI